MRDLDIADGNSCHPLLAVWDEWSLPKSQLSGPDQKSTCVPAKSHMVGNQMREWMDMPLSTAEAAAVAWDCGNSRCDKFNFRRQATYCCRLRTDHIFLSCWSHLEWSSAGNLCFPFQDLMKHNKPQLYSPSPSLIINSIFPALFGDLGLLIGCNLLMPPLQKHTLQPLPLSSPYKQLLRCRLRAPKLLLLVTRVGRARVGGKDPEQSGRRGSSGNSSVSSDSGARSWGAQVWGSWLPSPPSEPLLLLFHHGERKVKAGWHQRIIQEHFSGCSTLRTCWVGMERRRWRSARKQHWLFTINAQLGVFNW